MKLQEIWFYIWNTPYFEVHVLKDNRIITTLIQPIINNTKTGHIAVTWKKKYAWLILATSAFVKKNKFIVFVDIENCIPLIDSERIETTTSELYITEKTIVTLKKSGVKIVDYNTDASGRQKIFKGAIIPPVVFHQMVSAHFIHETLKNPPSKWEEMKNAVIVAVIGLVVIALVYMLG
jgi:hypothetical protein